MQKLYFAGHFSKIEYILNVFECDTKCASKIMKIIYICLVQFNQKYLTKIDIGIIHFIIFVVLLIILCLSSACTSFTKLNIILSIHLIVVLVLRSVCLFVCFCWSKNCNSRLFLKIFDAFTYSNVLSVNCNLIL